MCLKPKDILVCIELNPGPVPGIFGQGPPPVLDLESYESKLKREIDEHKDYIGARIYNNKRAALTALYGAQQEGDSAAELVIKQNIEKKYGHEPLLDPESRGVEDVYPSLEFPKVKRRLRVEGLDELSKSVRGFKKFISRGNEPNIHRPTPGLLPGMPDYIEPEGPNKYQDDYNDYLREHEDREHGGREDDYRELTRRRKANDQINRDLEGSLENYTNALFKASRGPSEDYEISREDQLETEPMTHAVVKKSRKRDDIIEEGSEGFRRIVVPDIVREQIREMEHRRMRGGVDPYLERHLRAANRYRYSYASVPETVQPLPRQQGRPRLPPGDFETNYRRAENRYHSARRRGTTEDHEDLIKQFKRRSAARFIRNRFPSQQEIQRRLASQQEIRRILAAIDDIPSEEEEAPRRRLLPRRTLSRRENPLDPNQYGFGLRIKKIYSGKGLPGSAKSNAIKILKGEMGCGNNNPKLKERLKRLTKKR